MSEDEETLGGPGFTPVGPQGRSLPFDLGSSSEKWDPDHG